MTTLATSDSFKTNTQLEADKMEAIEELNSLGITKVCGRDPQTFPLDELQAVVRLKRNQTFSQRKEK